MQNLKYKCDNCGTEYDEWRAYCRKCQTAMPKKGIEIEEKLEGYSKELVCSTIGSKSERYYPIFKEHEGEKTFNHMNWAAFFFGTYWMFYRKMYKNGVILLLATIALSVVTVFIAAALIKPQVKKLEKQFEPYIAFVEQIDEISDEEYEEFFKNHSRDELQKAVDAYENKMFAIEVEIFAISVVSTLGLMIFVGLRADSMYKKFVLQNVNTSVKGTSVWSIVLAIVLEYAVVEIYERVLEKVLDKLI